MLELEDYAGVINEKMEEVKTDIMKIKEKWTNVLAEQEDLKENSVMADFDEVIENWQSLVDIQRILFNKIEQQALNNSIEITGVPEKYAKSTHGVAQVLSKLLRIYVSENYVLNFRRVGDLADPESNAQDPSPRPLVVDLINKNIKKRIMTVAKTVVLSLNGSDLPINISHHLTPLNRQLLKKTREEAISHGINHVWIEDGNIMVRRSGSSFLYEIRNELDIEHMYQF